MNGFKGIKPGDKVRFYGRINGAGQPPIETVAAVNPLLIFDEHVVVNHGPFGRVVNALNYISHKPYGARRKA